MTTINLKALKERLHELADKYAEAKNWQAAFAILEVIGIIIEHETYID